MAIKAHLLKSTWGSRINVAYFKGNKATIDLTRSQTYSGTASTSIATILGSMARAGVFLRKLKKPGGISRLSTIGKG